MATITNTNPTLSDWTESLGPDGQIATVIEILSQVNEILSTMTVMEGNLPTGHRTTVRTGLPEGTWRRLYKGVANVKTARATITDTCGMLEAYNEVDKDLAYLNNNTAEVRAQEARGTMEGMSQQVASTLFYGNTVTHPERFDGFAPRFNLLSAGNGENIINGGGVGTDNHSIWLVVWHPDTCAAIVPKGSMAGLQMHDKGQETLTDADGLKFEGYRTHFQWKLGLSVRDWRYVVRIANIDKSLLTADISTGADLPDLMFRAVELLPSSTPAGARMCWYMNRTVRTFFRQQLAFKTKQSTLEWQNVAGHRVSVWPEGIYIHRCDALAIDEARVQ